MDNIEGSLFETPLFSGKNNNQFDSHSLAYNQRSIIGNGSGEGIMFAELEEEDISVKNYSDIMRRP